MQTESKENKNNIAPKSDNKSDTKSQQKNIKLSVVAKAEKQGDEKLTDITIESDHDKMIIGKAKDIDDDDVDKKHNDNETYEENMEISVDDRIDGYQPSDNNQDIWCYSCCKKSIYRATMAIILYIMFGMVYLSDILTMLVLYYPQKGGGIDGCDCNVDGLNKESDCILCWNCIWHKDSNSCDNFDDNGNTELIQWLFPIIFGFCAGGWLIIELTMWIRLCIICNLYNKENVKYQEQREKESDEFIIANNVGAYTDKDGKLKKLTTMDMDCDDKDEKIEMNQIRNKLTIQKNDTLMHYDEDYDNDIMGLLPCCFQDIDHFHMLIILMMNTEKDQILYDSSYQIDMNSSKRRAGDIGNDCCQFPCFMFGFSLSTLWLFPFRYFWAIAICDLKSDFWKRVCWFSLLHSIFYDVVWILFSYLIFETMDKAKTNGLNDYVDSLGGYLERKIYASYAMILMILIVWFTIPIYSSLIASNHSSSTKKSNKGQSYRSILT